MIAIFVLCAALPNDTPQPRVFHDGKGHYLVVRPEKERWRLFVGDEKALVEQRLEGRSKNGSKWTLSFWEPRIKEEQQKVVRGDDARAEVQCGARKIAFTEDEAGAAAFLARAELRPPLWTRAAFLLARDNEGTYFYVDRALEPEGNTNFHVYAGKRGRAVRLKIDNLVADSEGYVFATASGSLRIVLDKHESFWIEGKKKTPLTQLEAIDNRALVYGELGAYDGQTFGTACDLL